jgi:hypothetical protein
MEQGQATEALKQRNSDIRRGRAFADMLNTEGWKEYEKLLNSHISQRMEQLITPTPPMGELGAEHNKGAVYALTFARDLPRVTVEAAKELAKSGPATDGDD